MHTKNLRKIETVIKRDEKMGKEQGRGRAERKPAVRMESKCHIHWKTWERKASCMAGIITTQRKAQTSISDEAREEKRRRKRSSKNKKQLEE